MRPPVLAQLDPRLRAHITRRWLLRYDEGECLQTDRPAIVRAASGITSFGDELAIVQDDANFLALLSPGGPVRAVALPVGAGGRRQFEKALGNKLDKLDLESCLSLEDDARPGTPSRVLAFGSGSLPVRAVVLSYEPSAAKSVRLVEARSLYDELAAHIGRAELNIEGVTLTAEALLFFQRSNGVAGEPPAVLEVDRAEFFAWLDDDGAAPRVRAVTRYDLGSIRDVPFGFTDACSFGRDRVLYLASAEDSADAIEDGDVLGSRVGVMEGVRPGQEPRVRWAPLVDDAEPSIPLKAEGITLLGTRTNRAFIVLDPDDPLQPAHLCEVALEGPWA